VWVAVPFALALGHTAGERLLLWPALSGGAILLHRLTEHREEPAEPRFEPTPVLYHEEEP
jgi:hypothetical protein